MLGASKVLIPGNIRLYIVVILMSKTVIVITVKHLLTFVTSTFYNQG